MDADAARFVRELDLRYTGQGYELCTPLEGLFTDRLTNGSLAAARDKFDERHAQIHGHAAKERPVEVVSYRVRVRCLTADNGGQMFDHPLPCGA
jgi:N-methylhydantoinase A